LLVALAAAAGACASLPPGERVLGDQLREAQRARREHRDGDAERALRAAVDLSPDRVELRYALVAILIRQGAWDRASRELQETRREFDEPDPPAAVRLKAALALHAGRVAQASGMYRSLLASNPRDAAAWVGLALAQLGQGDVAEARALLDRAAALAPRGAIVFYDRALVRWRQGEPDGALEDARRAVALDPLYPEARNNLAALLLSLRRPAEAEVELRAALAQHPAYAAAHGNLGVARLDQGDLRGAVTALEAAVAHAPRQTAYHFNLGLAWHRLGNLDAARSEFQRVLEIDPGNQGAARNLRFLEGIRGGLLQGTELPAGVVQRPDPASAASVTG
jgi:Tfp pilus assembly protein PilF